VSSKSLISIVIPCYNAERFVRYAILSALEQTYAPVEVIVVDDGSTDRSRDIVSSFGSAVVPVVGPHRGAAAARNKGLELARGEYVQFLDADDVLLPTKLEVCAAGFTPSTDLVFCEMRYFTDEPAEPRRVLASARSIVASLRRQEMEWDPSRVLEYTLRASIGTPAPLHRTSRLRQAGGFRPDLRNLDDIELHFRLALSGFKFHKIPEVLVHCRNHSTEGRLRRAGDRNLSAIRATRLMYEQAERAGMLDRTIRHALSDKFANYGRKAFRQGYRHEASDAFRTARELSRFPRPTGVPLYNVLSWLLGLYRTESLMAMLVPGHAHNA
jgi:glycosyltransferase involved in cell wall biosynthesis